jgi:hypothetical protein
VTWGMFGGVRLGEVRLGLVSKRAQAAGFHMHHRRRVTVPLGEWHSSHVGTSYIKPGGGVSEHVSEDGGRRVAAEGHHEIVSLQLARNLTPVPSRTTSPARTHRLGTLFC